MYSFRCILVYIKTAKLQDNICSFYCICASAHKLWLWLCACVRACARVCRGQLKCDGTSAETRFRLPAKRTSPFISAGASVQSTTGSRGVRISGSNAKYTMFRGSVKNIGYPLHPPFFNASAINFNTI